MSFNNTDYELLSAYIDEMLEDDQRSALEARLQQEPELQEELTALRQTVALVNQLPEMKAPRNFTLTPEMVAPPRQRKIIFMPMLSAAAAVMMMVIGAVLLLSVEDVPESMPASAPIEMTQAIVGGTSNTTLQDGTPMPTSVAMQEVQRATAADGGDGSGGESPADMTEDDQADEAEIMEEEAADMDTFSAPTQTIKPGMGGAGSTVPGSPPPAAIMIEPIPTTESMPEAAMVIPATEEPSNTMRAIQATATIVTLPTPTIAPPAEPNLVQSDDEPPLLPLILIGGGGLLFVISGIWWYRQS